MTTHELAKKLLEFDNILVLVDGYEGGFESEITIGAIEVYGPHERSYFGNYDSDCAWNESTISTPAIAISR